MINIISECATFTIPDPSALNIHKNPAYIQGLQFVVHTRLLFFRTREGSCYIDFIPHAIVPDTIYIVQPLHFHHLRYDDDVICIDADHLALSPYHRQLLYLLKYTASKSLQVKLIPGLSCFDVLQDILACPDNKAEQLKHTITRWIEDSLPLTLLAKCRRPFHYVEAADKLLQLLREKELSHDTCKIPQLATEMYCSERNLQRICNSIFGVGTRDVLKYHLAIKAVYLLSGLTRSVSDVACELGFSNISVFDRYMRRATGHSPSEIRTALSSFSS